MVAVPSLFLPIRGLSTSTASSSIASPIWQSCRVGARAPLRTMATVSRIQLSPAQAGACHADNISSESAKKASEVLQENHDKNHDIFNLRGFHNHCVHHILTVYALGGTPSEIQAAWDTNKYYQMDKIKGDKQVVEQMRDRKKFRGYQADQHHYANFETFFAQEIEAKGWEAVLNEYLFAGDELADNMLFRLLAGFLHPFIQLGFGVEFRQPAIMAEGLAQTACHRDYEGPFFMKAENMAKETSTSKSMVELIQEIEESETLKRFVREDDEQKFSQGLLQRGLDEITRVVAQWKVTPEELEEKTAEVINASAYFAGAAQHPPKQVKFDFFYMHAINSNLFLSEFCSPSSTYLSTAAKCRLVEWKGRLDLAIYKGFGSPKLLVTEITGYQPRGGLGSWEDVFHRACNVTDDGHCSKFIRSLANGEKVCARYEAKDTFKIKGGMWLKLAHMVLDSVEPVGEVPGHDTRWARGVGFESAWEEFQDRPRL